MDDGLGAADGLSRSLGSFSTSRGVARSFMKIPRADEDGLGAQLHHQGGVGRGGDAAGGEVGHGQLARLGDHANEFV